MIVVGLTGRAGSGKSVVADHLVSAHGFTKLSFAGPLKQMLRTLDPVVGFEEQGRELSPDPVRLSDLHDKHWTEHGIKTSIYGPEYRRLLQVLGTDCIRAVDDGFWVRAAVAQLTDPEGRYVFDDCRFPNEATAIKVSGLFRHSSLWHVARPGHDGGAGSHTSEQHAGNMGEDLELPNIGTVSDLQEAVDIALKGTIDPLHTKEKADVRSNHLAVHHRVRPVPVVDPGAHHHGALHGVQGDGPVPGQSVPEIIAEYTSDIGGL